MTWNATDAPFGLRGPSVAICEAKWREKFASGDARNPSSRAWLAMGATKCDEEAGSGDYGWKDITPLARYPE